MKNGLGSTTEKSGHRKDYILVSAGNLLIFYILGYGYPGGQQ